MVDIPSKIEVLLFVLLIGPAKDPLDPARELCHHLGGVILLLFGLVLI